MITDKLAFSSRGIGVVLSFLSDDVTDSSQAAFLWIKDVAHDLSLIAGK